MAGINERKRGILPNEDGSFSPTEFQVHYFNLQLGFLQEKAEAIIGTEPPASEWTWAATEANPPRLRIRFKDVPYKRKLAQVAVVVGREGDSPTVRLPYISFQTNVDMIDEITVHESLMPDGDREVYRGEVSHEKFYSSWDEAYDIRRQRDKEKQRVEILKQRLSRIDKTDHAGTLLLGEPSRDHLGWALKCVIGLVQNFKPASMEWICGTEPVRKWTSSE